ncbi:MAG: methyltransferase domain-containing protein [Desulfosporosinus sp.]
MGVKHFNGEVDSEYLKESAKLVEKIKEQSYEMMHLKCGMKVLDLGCGLGIDVRRMAGMVGQNGKVIGLDNDEKMIAEAQQDNQSANAEFIQSDVCSIPFDDNTFDAVRAERLFQVLPITIDMNEVIREIIRVTKESGIIVLVDSDWGTASVNYEDAEVTNRLLHFFAKQCRPNGYAGRQFYELMKKHGLNVEGIEALPVYMFNFAETPFEQWLTKEALEKGIASEKEMQSWNVELKRKTENREFFGLVNMIIVVGRKMAASIMSLKP